MTYPGLALARARPTIVEDIHAEERTSMSDIDKHHGARRRRLSRQRVVSTCDAEAFPIRVSQKDWQMILLHLLVSRRRHTGATPRKLGNLQAHVAILSHLLEDGCRC